MKDTDLIEIDLTPEDIENLAKENIKFKCPCTLAEAEALEDEVENLEVYYADMDYIDPRANIYANIFDKIFNKIESFYEE